jgi:hypothetical protein
MWTGRWTSPRRRRGILWRRPPFRGGGSNPIGVGAMPRAPGMDSFLPDDVDSVLPSSAVDLCKPGDETPVTVTGGGGPPKQLYTVLRKAAAGGYAQSGAVFASDHGRSGGGRKRPVQVGRDRRGGRRGEEGEDDTWPTRTRQTS